MRNPVDPCGDGRAYIDQLEIRVLGRSPYSLRSFDFSNRRNCNDCSVTWLRVESDCGWQSPQNAKSGTIVEAFYVHSHIRRRDCTRDPPFGAHPKVTGSPDSRFTGEMLSLCHFPVKRELGDKVRGMLAL